MRKRIDILLSDLRSRRHLDAYVAILIGIVLALLALLGIVRAEVLAAGILMTLSFVLWATLAVRHQLDEIVRSTGFPGSKYVLKFADYPSAAMRSQLRAAKDISLSGLTFLRFFPLFGNDLEHALRTGARVRVALADPDSAAMDMAHFRSDFHVSPGTEQQRALAAIEFISNLRTRVSGAKIQVRKHPYLSPYAMMIIQPADPQMSAYHHARLLPFRTSSMRAPTILPNSSDREWVEFIETQFEALWNASTEVDLAVPVAVPSNTPLQPTAEQRGG